MDSTPSLAGVVGGKALPRGPVRCRGPVHEEPGLCADKPVLYSSKLAAQVWPEGRQGAGGGNVSKS